MIKDSKYADNKELMIIQGAVHTDLYNGGDKDYIPFDRLQAFFSEHLNKNTGCNEADKTRASGA